MIQDERNRNILSEAAMAVNWGNTSLNPRGGVSSFRFLQEEKEQSTLFYLCGPPAQLSFSLPVSAPLSLLLCLVHSSQMRLVLCSGGVCMCMWSLISSLEIPLYPSGHLYDLSFLLPLPMLSMSMHIPKFIPKTISHISFTMSFTVYFVQWPLTFLPTSFRIHLMQSQNMWGNRICGGWYQLAALSVYRIDTSVCPPDRFNTCSHPKYTVAGSYVA